MNRRNEYATNPLDTPTANMLTPATQDFIAKQAGVGVKQYSGLDDNLQATDYYDGPGARTDLRKLKAKPILKVTNVSSSDDRSSGSSSKAETDSEDTAGEVSNQINKVKQPKFSAVTPMSSKANLNQKKTPSRRPAANKKPVV